MAGEFSSDARVWASAPVPFERLAADGPPLGVIDIGSNSIRLVVYAGCTRAPVEMHNESVLCELGRDAAQTGHLYAAGVDCALSSLRRFTRIAKGMGVSQIRAFATAAVRDASNRDAFLARVHDACGLTVEVISGEREATLSALGVRSGIPTARGVMGDLGGSSLELVGIKRSGLTGQVTTPLGPLRLPTGTRDVAKQFIKRHLYAVDWLDDFGGQTLYPVGGAWRTVAKRLQKLNKQRYPIQIVQNLRFDAMKVRDLAHELSKKSPEELSGLDGVKERRAVHLPRACLVLSRLIKRLRPKDVVFSAYGIREGLLWESLDTEQRRLDPLLEYCRGLERAVGKAHQGGPLADWITPLFDDADHPGLRRLRLAACILSDIGWFDHPDYRAYHAAERTLRLPYAGIEHWERAWLSAAVHARYSGDVGALALNEMAPLMGEAGIDWARRVGRALRLAHNLCGGAISLLQSTAIAVEDRTVVLRVPEEQTYMVGDATKRRLAYLAEALGGLTWRLG